MGTKIKGVFKSFKYISQIFVVKEREMDIGYPTDVKHVAHIGWDGQQTSAPSWMNEFKSDFSASSLSNLSEPKESNRVHLSPWSSQDFEQSSMQTASDIFKDEYFSTPPTDLPKVPKKHKRKKTRSSTSSPRSSTSTSRSSIGAASGAAATTSRASAFSTEVYMTPNSRGIVAIP